jgi:hypothetical protein
MTTDLLLVYRFDYTIDRKSTIHKRYFSALWKKIYALKKSMTVAQRALSVKHKEGKERSSLNKTFLKKRLLYS